MAEHDGFVLLEAELFSGRVVWTEAFELTTIGAVRKKVESYLYFKEDGYDLTDCSRGSWVRPSREWGWLWFPRQMSAARYGVHRGVAFGIYEEDEHLFYGLVLTSLPVLLPTSYERRLRKLTHEQTNLALNASTMSEWSTSPDEATDRVKSTIDALVHEPAD